MSDENRSKYDRMDPILVSYIAKDGARIAEFKIEADASDESVMIWFRDRDQDMACSWITEEATLQLVDALMTALCYARDQKAKLNDSQS